MEKDFKTLFFALYGKVTNLARDMNGEVYVGAQKV